MKKHQYLCVVLDRQTKAELVSYTIEIEIEINPYFTPDPDDHFYHRMARFQAVVRFEKDFPEFKTDEYWYVDSCLLPE
jgi:hypothetical protein